jgi:hypothetical protein
VPLLIPPSINYPSPMTPFVSRSQDEPVEGRKQVPVEIEWATMGGASKCVGFNLMQASTLPITQISAIKVDLADCGADVRFMFPDTSDTITIEAGSQVVVPVYSNARVFYVHAPNAIASDVTRFQLLNYKADLLDVSQPEQRASVVSTNKPITNVPALMPLIPAGINGTLEILKLSVTPGPSSPAAYSVGDFDVYDNQVPGTGLVNVQNWTMGMKVGNLDIMVPIIDLSNINVRFINGLDVLWTPSIGWAFPNEYRVNMFATYRIP